MNHRTPHPFEISGRDEVSYENNFKDLRNPMDVVNSYELRSPEFPRSPSAARPEYFTNPQFSGETQTPTNYVLRSFLVLLPLRVRSTASPTQIFDFTTASPTQIFESRTKILPLAESPNPHNYWFLVSFSLLSILFHFIPSNREFHNMLYSANILSLVGFTSMIWLYPDALYDAYLETHLEMARYVGISRVSIMKWMNRTIFNTIVWAIHLIPVILLANVYSIGNPLLLVLCYLIVFGAYLEKIYSMPLWAILFSGVLGLCAVYIV
jgi:hypothetical protein